MVDKFIASEASQPSRAKFFHIFKQVLVMHSFQHINPPTHAHILLAIKMKHSLQLQIYMLRARVVSGYSTGACGKGCIWI